MGAKERDKIFKGIKNLAQVGTYEIYRGTVDSVDTTQLTFDLKLNTGAVIPDVRLKVIFNDTEGVYVLPRQGSKVVAAKMENGVEFCLIQCSQIDKWFIKIGNTTFEIDSGLIKANGGNNKGLVKVVELTQKLNNIETVVNKIITALNSWIPVPNDGGAALKTLITAALLQNLTPTAQANIEDTSFTH